MADPLFDLAGKSVWVAGHNGMVGSAVVRRLARERCDILTVERSRVDLRDPAATLRWMLDATPDVVVVAAAKVGGIAANDRYPATFLSDNLAIQSSIIDAAARQDVDKLIFLGSSCIYPKFAPQPIREESLLEGPLEPTNQWYALAKIAGLKLCQAYRREGGHDFISAMPTNLYGPGDNYDTEGSHVIPGLLRKAHAAKTDGSPEMLVWGSGQPRREFLYVDDLADAIVFMLKHYSEESPLNVGCGEDVTIRELAEAIQSTVGFAGKLLFDPSRPDGTPRKLLDVSRLTALGWRPHVTLQNGLARTYADYVAGGGRR